MKITSKLLVGFTMSISVPIVFASETPSLYQDKIDSSRSEISRKAIKDPSSRRDAYVRFTKTKNRKEITRWIENHSVDILSARGVFHYGDKKIYISAPDLSGYDAPLDEVLAQQHAEYHQEMIDDMLSDLKGKIDATYNPLEKRKLRKERRALLAARKNPISWSELHIIGDYEQLDIANDDRDVLGVVLEGSNIAKKHDEIWKNPSKTRRSLNEIKRRDRKKAIKSAKFRPANRNVSIYDEAIHGMKKGAIGLATTVIDAIFPKTWAAGIICGPGVPGENNCPPDANWLPGFPSYYTLFQQYEHGYMRGLAHTSTRWSSTELQAYKGASLPRCNPNYTGTEAKCATSSGPQHDVIYVPNSTFEAEMDIPNPNCGFRWNNPNIDRQNGCFVPYWAGSDYPSAYLDTTLFDSSDRYNATVGTANPAALSAGVTYNNYVYFETRGEYLGDLVTSSLAEPVRLNGQIGTLINGLCSLGIPYCSFAVDITTVDTSIITVN